MAGSTSPPAPPVTPSTPYGSRTTGGLSEEERLRAQRRFLEERLGASPLPSTAMSSGALANGTSYGSTPGQDSVRSRITPEDTVAAAALQLASRAGELHRDTRSDCADETDPDETTVPVGGEAPEEEDEEYLAVYPSATFDPNEAEVMYDPSADAHRKDREVKVTPVTIYQSQYSESGARRISASSQLISYAVKEHIRIIARISARRCLLKAHSEAVVDMEFVGYDIEGASESLVGPHLLGSCGLDGDVYLWKIEDKVEALQANPELSLIGFTKWKHPASSSGSYYSRIRFHHASEKPRFALADGSSPDIRVLIANGTSAEGSGFSFAEGVLTGSHKAESSVQDALWLDAWTLATSGSDGMICMWDIQTSLPMRLFYPFGPTLSAPGLAAIRERYLVTSNNSGRLLKIWKDPLAKTRDLQVVQVVKIEDANAVNFFAVDPYGEFIVLSNIPGKAMYVFHVNETYGTVDSVTEFPFRQFTLSLCVTRKKERLVETGANGVPAVKFLDELGVWCVQSKAIQLYHLPVSHCSPRENKRWFTRASKRERPDTPNTASQNDREDMEVIAPPNSVDPPTPVAMDEPLRPSDDSRILSGSSKSTTANGTPLKPKAEEIVNPKPEETSRENLHLNSVPSTGQTAGKSRDAQEIPEEKPRRSSLDADNVANAIRDCIGAESSRILEKLEEQFSQREAKDKEVTARLLALVSETVDSNVMCFVDSAIGQAMEKDLSGLVQPCITKVVEETVTPVMVESAVNSSLRTIDALPRAVGGCIEALQLERAFKDVLDAASVDQCYKDACAEMTSQIVSSLMMDIRKLIEDKVGDSLVAMISAASDAHDATEEFQRALASLSLIPPASVNKIEVDSRALVDSFLREKNYEMAFQTALSTKDGEVVYQLCRDVDMEEILDAGSDQASDSAKISQELACQLATSLCENLEDDSSSRLTWIKDCLLLLDPELNESLAPLISSTAQLLRPRLENFRNMLVEGGADPGVARTCKIAARLAASLEN
mmetsp:Transcript_10241/g.20655  ORF Transcript_10241/g.20655 Transcript_10241/m.20655 type:complete len:1004 (-) Transcript_10241:987-3998(-)|eukprot:CAMPEP_0184687548 /NCGR_PEP_ID=MMETSP0312-20130426/26811_1 /TAXON_ID=31354 /ORGANISM="Compsopogon coeruleus, Strain SAG 36.94" /LENGTH=1003 /DNA_ID=CAMNT_0027143817 /DNA_START=260 /DNA_END=3271 /DNA_ORIENTATION=+